MILVKFAVLLLLTYFWARGLTTEYEVKIEELEKKLEEQKVRYEEEKLELEIMIKLMEARL